MKPLHRLLVLLLLVSANGFAHDFVHPGILHNKEGLLRIKSNVKQGEEPWKSGYAVFNEDPRASYEYEMKGPFKYVSRSGSKPGESNLHKTDFNNDCQAAYYNAVQWVITGDQRHADKSIEIMNGYSRKLKGIINHDKELMSPLNGFLLVNAAEIIRYTNTGWDSLDITQFEKMIRDVFYPVIENFATFANGNWDAACIKGMISFAVFLDDREMFDKAVEYYLHGEGNGCITHYIVNEAGQCQESGRDQAHTQFGMGCLAEACEVAFNQGADLYGANDNRLLKGFEYTAKYNLGEDVPFEEWTDTTGKYHHTEIASHDRGQFRGVYEIVLNHYQRRMGMDTPYTAQAAEKVRPEGKPWTADHPGYGTLLYSLPTTTTTIRGTRTITSPDGRINCTLAATPAGSSDGIVQYAISRDGQTVILPSPFRLETADGKHYDGFSIVNVETNAVDQEWDNPFGELRVVPDRYREIKLVLKKDGERLNFICRVYNEGVALAYAMPARSETGAVSIVDESFVFRFPKDHPCWAVNRPQGIYEQIPISRLKDRCIQPLVIECDPDLTVALAEAALVDFARMQFGSDADHSTAVRTVLDGPTVKHLPAQSPWRVVMLADNPGQLLEQNYLIQNLNPPCALADTSWIKPGKVLREGSLTTAGGKACVEFVAEHGMQYVEFDAGWYGPENDMDSDATTITLDPKRSNGPLDLEEVIEYANSKDIGVILYVNRRALEQQLDDLLPLYQSWGVAGIKYGFVQVGSQDVTRWLHEAVMNTADYKMIVDIHDQYRPTGFSRRYPNLLSQEGIRGDEESIPNSHTLITMFTRMLAGAADNTICYYADRVDEKMGSHASQLAKSVCLFSPLQFLYWYDVPPDGPAKDDGQWGKSNMIGNEPELEFFDRVPTVWDETRVLYGKIGEFALIARRSGVDWFVGGINGESPEMVTMKFDFLEPGKTYNLKIYSDDPSVKTRTHVRIEETDVTSQSKYPIELKRNNGIAMHITPANPQ